MYRVYPPYDAAYYVGVDLGQQQDSTAIAVVEEPVYVHRLDRLQIPVDREGWYAPDSFPPEALEAIWQAMFRHGRPHGPTLRARHLERLPLGTNYVDVVSHVKRLLATPPLVDRPCCLVVDITGVGRGVYDLMRRAGLEAIGIAIHGGSELSVTAEGWSAPKRDLISATQVRLQSGTLQIAASLPETPTLIQELVNYRVKIDERTAHDSYNARSGAHDDLVLALCLAVWFRDTWLRHYDDALNGTMSRSEYMSRG